MSERLDLDAIPSRYTFDEYTNEINVFNYRIGYLITRIRKLRLMRMEVCDHIYEMSQIAGDNSICIKCGHEITEHAHIKMLAGI